MQFLTLTALFSIVSLKSCFASLLDSGADMCFHGSKEVGKAKAMLQVRAKPMIARELFTEIEDVGTSVQTSQRCASIFQNGPAGLLDSDSLFDKARHCLPRAIVTHYLDEKAKQKSSMTLSQPSRATTAALDPRLPLRQGDIIKLEHPHDLVFAAVGFMGNYGTDIASVPGCSSTDSNMGVFAYNNVNQSHLAITVDVEDGVTYFTQADKTSYLGMCADGAEPCSGSSKRAIGVSGKTVNSQWVIEEAIDKYGTYVYLKNVASGTYLGACGEGSDAGGSYYNLYGFEEKMPECTKNIQCRTAWNIEFLFREATTTTTGNPDATAVATTTVVTTSTTTTPPTGDVQLPMRSGDIVKLEHPHDMVFAAIGYFGNVGVDVPAVSGCNIFESKHGVYAYNDINQPRSMLTVERDGAFHYFSHSDFTGYIGMCGDGSDSCSGSTHRVMGLTNKDASTQWLVEPYNDTVGNYIYLKNVATNTYIGVCAGGSNAGGSHYDLHGYEERMPACEKHIQCRTAWQVEYISRIATTTTTTTTTTITTTSTTTTTTATTTTTTTTTTKTTTTTSTASTTTTTTSTTTTTTLTTTTTTTTQTTTTTTKTTTTTTNTTTTTTTTTTMTTTTTTTKATTTTTITTTTTTSTTTTVKTTARKSTTTRATASTSDELTTTEVLTSTEAASTTEGATTTEPITTTEASTTPGATTSASDTSKITSTAAASGSTTESPSTTPAIAASAADPAVAASAADPAENSTDCAYAIIEEALPGATSLDVAQKSCFFVGQSLVLGKNTSSEEIVVVASVGTQLKLKGPLKFAHRAGQPITIDAANAPITAAGFKTVTSLCCPPEMEVFFMRVLDLQGLQVCSMPHVQGLMHWFTCVPDMDYQYMLDTIATGNPCKYWGIKGGVCPELSKECAGEQMCR